MQLKSRWAYWEGMCGGGVRGGGSPPVSTIYHLLFIPSDNRTKGRDGSRHAGLRVSPIRIPIREAEKNPPPIRPPTLELHLAGYAGYR